MTKQVYEEMRREVKEVLSAKLDALGRGRPAQPDEQPKAMSCDTHGAFEAIAKETPGSSIRRNMYRTSQPEMWWHEACPACVAEARRMHDSALAQIEVDEQAAAKERLLRGRISEAGVVPRHRFYELDDLTPVDDKQARALDALKGLVGKVLDDETAPNIILLGGVGTGKSLLGAAAAQSLIRGGKMAFYITAKGLVREFRATWEKDASMTEAAFVDRMTRVPLLVVDELGLSAGTDNELAIIFEVLDGRYQNMKPTVLISNLDMAGVKAAIGERCVDRLREDGGRVIALDYASQRGNAP